MPRQIVSRVCSIGLTITRLVESLQRYMTLTVLALQRFNDLTRAPRHHCPSGVVASVPAGGLNSNVDAGIGARVWFEYLVTMRSPLGNSMSVPSTRNFSLIFRSSF